MTIADTAGRAAKLYTPEILGLAVELADFPRLTDADLSVEVRSRSCGSSLVMDLTCDGGGPVSAIGLRVTACAIGQAAAVIFARTAIAKTLLTLEQSKSEVVHWLGGREELPDWQGIEVLQNARDYPGRHEAILLPWRAAVEALSIA